MNFNLFSICFSIIILLFVSNETTHSIQSEDINSHSSNLLSQMTSTRTKSYKICVYAIAKNEENKVDSFMNWAKYANYVAILDTGSTDKTIELFKNHGVRTETHIFNPFRFDHARNYALELLPDDCEIAVTGDLDNIYYPIESWRSIVERVWDSHSINRIDFPWYYDMINNPTYYNFDKRYIHSRHGFSWEFPIHEKLIPHEGVEEKSLEIYEIQLLEYPEVKKKEYATELLELAVLEYPMSSAHQLWLAIDYHGQGRYVESIEHYKQHLVGNTVGFPWIHSPHIMAFCKRTIGKAYWQYGDNENAELWYKEACREKPNEREVWNDLSSFYYATERYMESYLAAHKGWMVPLQNRVWDWPVDDCAWGECIPQNIARSAWELNLVSDSCKFSTIAFDYAMKDRDRELRDKSCPLVKPPIHEFPVGA